MKKQLYSDKFSVLIAICDHDQQGDLEEFLRSKKLGNGLLFMGKGTAESTVADLFGFGLSDKIISAVLVKESKQDKIIKELSDVLKIEEDRYGLTMLLEVSSASSVVLDMMGIKLES